MHRKSSILLLALLIYALTPVSPLQLILPASCASDFCLYFDGNDYVQVAEHSSLNFSGGEFTFSHWIKTNTTNWSYILSRVDSDLWSAYFFTDIGSDGTVEGAIAEPWTSILSSSDYNDDTWHQIVFLRDSGTLKLYVDNSLADSTDGSEINFDSNQPYILAGCLYDWDYNYTGYMDELWIFDRALNITEIDYLYTVKRQGLNNTGCVLHFDFDEGEGSTLIDDSGNGNNGTITGGQWMDNSELFSAPTWQSHGQNLTVIDRDGEISLYSQGYDDEGLDRAWLSTNETGAWKNYTRFYVGNVNLTDYTDLGIVITNDTFGVGGIEDNVVIRAHDEFYYMFLTNTTFPKGGGAGSFYNVLYAKSPYLNFSTISESGIAWGITKKRVFLIVHDETANKYQMIYFDTVISDLKMVTTTEGNFPTGWTNITTIINKGSGGAWDSWAVSGSCLFRYGDTFYYFYRGYDGTNKRIGYAYGNSLTNLAKSVDNPIHTPSQSWMSGGWDLRGATGLQFGTSGIATYEGNNGNIWTMGYTFIENITGTVRMTDFRDNPFQFNSPSENANPSWINPSAYGEQDATEPFYIYIGEGEPVGGSASVNWSQVRLIKYVAEYHSAIKLYDASQTWTWTNFTWTNSSASLGKVINWRIYYNDTFANINETTTSSFRVVEIVSGTDMYLWNTTDSVISSVIYSEERLSFTVTATTTSRTKVYCGLKGEPLRVTGASSWIYDSSTRICLLSVVHESAHNVILSWQQEQASGYFLLTVHLTEAGQPLGDVIVTVHPLDSIEKETHNVTTGLVGLAQFELPYGTYLVKARHDDKLKTMRVWLTGNKDVGLEFGTPPVDPRGDLIWVAVVVVIIILYFVIFRRR